MPQTVLTVENLQTHFFSAAGVVKAVDGVSFSVRAGEVMGLVGESGSGKSMTGYSIVGLVSEPGKVVGGSIRFKGEELRDLPESTLRAMRGNRISMVFQDPMVTLNPVLRIDTQMIEAIQAHRKVGKVRAREIARDMLARVGIPSPDERLLAYPHQFSGGMRQRVAIATAMLNDPELIICDEPTTALDVTIQGQILYEMQKMCSETGVALIWITHDLSVVAGLADFICVMYAGKIVESGSVGEILDRPRHPYTAGLIQSVPSRSKRGGMLRQIPGATPSLLNLGAGCAFRSRCEYASALCEGEPVSTCNRSGRTLRCHHPLRSGEST